MRSLNRADVHQGSSQSAIQALLSLPVDRLNVPGESHSSINSGSWSNASEIGRNGRDLLGKQRLEVRLLLPLGSALPELSHPHAPPPAQARYSV